MPFSFQKKPTDVRFIETKHRKISTKIPSENSIDILSSLENHEPNSMSYELPLVWDKAKGYQIFDSSGNIWIDFHLAYLSQMWDMLILLLKKP